MSYLEREERRPRQGDVLRIEQVDHDPTADVRPVAAIRDELVELAREAWAAGRVVDPHRLSSLADELAWASAFARLYGGSTDALDRFEAAVRETAELAQLARRNAAVAA
jgi:hypothetical protein